MMTVMLRHYKHICATTGHCMALIKSVLLSGLMNVTITKIVSCCNTLAKTNYYYQYMWTIFRSLLKVIVI